MRLLLPLLGLILSLSVYGQGTTTGTVTGRITDQGGTAMIGVTVVAVHTPSGTTFGTVTNEDGYYRLEHLRVGGPYTITATYTGFGDVAIEGVDVRLGETGKYDFKMQEAMYTN